MSIPSWACKQWGQYEHDWLDCFDCLNGYEVYLEEGENMVMEAIIDGNNVLEVDFDVLELLEKDGYVVRNDDPFQYNPAPGVTWNEIVTKVQEIDD
jgi:hypothetical protein